ncbi:MAG: prefoldin subunit beta [Candidatus Woesearchaeota archaeon]
MSEVQEKINQMQLIQQNMQNVAMQRQQFQIQETEIESALSELENSSENYKIIGNIMIKADSEKLKSELKERLEMLKIRINSLEKQEEKFRDKAEDIQKEVLKEIEKNDDKQGKTSGKNRRNNESSE